MDERPFTRNGALLWSVRLLALGTRNSTAAFCTIFGLRTTKVSWPANLDCACRLGAVVGSVCLSGRLGLDTLRCRRPIAQLLREVSSRASRRRASSACFGTFPRLVRCAKCIPLSSFWLLSSSKIDPCSFRCRHEGSHEVTKVKILIGRKVVCRCRQRKFSDLVIWIDLVLRSETGVFKFLALPEF